MTASKPYTKPNYLYGMLLQSRQLCISLDRELRIFLAGTGFLSPNAEELTSLFLHLLEVVQAQVEVIYSSELLWLIKHDQAAVDEKGVTWIDKYSDLEKRLYKIYHVGSLLTSQLKFIYGSTTNINRWGIVAQVDRLCRNLEPNARVILRPRWKNMYSYISISKDLFELSEEAEQSDSKLKKALFDSIFPEGFLTSKFYASLAYPPISASNILHMGIWGHEIGHLVDNIEGMKLVASRITGTQEIEKRATETKKTELNLSNYLSVEIAKDYEMSIGDEDAGGLKKRKGSKPSLTRRTYSDSEKAFATNFLLSYREYCASQYFSDLFAVRLFGPAAIFALVEFTKPINPFIDQMTPTHISIRERLRVMLRGFYRWYDLRDIKVMSKNDRPIAAFLIRTIRYLQEIAMSEVPPVFPVNEKKPSLENNQLLKELYPFNKDKISNMVDGLIEKVGEIADKDKDCFFCDEDFQLVFKGVQDLYEFLPPEYIDSDLSSPLNGRIRKKAISLAINSGWLSWLMRIMTNNIDKKDLIGNIPALSGFDDINVLILKSIENAETKEWFTSRRSFGIRTDEDDQFTDKDEKKEPDGSLPDDIDKVNTAEINQAAVPAKKKLLDDAPLGRFGGVLSRDSLLRRLKSDDKDRLVIRPFLDPRSQMGTCSFDVRLGNTFMVVRYQNNSSQVLLTTNVESRIDMYQEKLYMPFGRPFMLHPGQLVIAKTLEYFSIPDDLMGLLIERESWGSMGLILATRSKIVPGHKGCITLTLSNIGNGSIPLYPFSRIGQILFYTLS
jgi:dCTP deaminase